MNKGLLYTAFFLLTSIACGSLQAQSIEAEINKIRGAYLMHQQISFDVDVYSYSTDADKTADLMSKGFMKKSNEKYYSNFNNYELLINMDKALIVDRERRIMDYFEYKKAKPEINLGYQVNIDSLVSATDSIVLRPTVNGLKHMTCFSKNGYINQTELFVDPQTYFIKRILYYYINSNEDFEIDIDRVEIFYNNIQTTSIDERFFNFEKYFKKAGTSITPMGEYRGYEMNYHNSES